MPVPPSPSWAPSGSTLWYEVRSGTGDAALVVLLCGGCGAELTKMQTDVPRGAVVGDRERLEPLVVARALREIAHVARCVRCSTELPGPTVTGRVWVPDSELSERARATG
jgi:hypothetical protein